MPAAAKDFFESLAWELEGYDDIHASARLRRDLLRRVGPAVVEEACDAPREQGRADPDRASPSTAAPCRAMPNPRMLLTDFLRHVIGATGTHVGCEHGVCGCCTVLIDGTAVRGCLTLAVQAEGRTVTTVESLASPDGTLNALQQAFQQHHALQCGFCTPGILMSFTDYLARNPHPTEDEIREVLSGHLCRCTGYAGIVAAVLAASGGAAETRKPEPAMSTKALIANW